MAAPAVRTAIPAQIQGRTAASERCSFVDSVSSRLTPHEWRRRLVHMSPGIFPFVFMSIPHADPLPYQAMFPVVAVTLLFTLIALLKTALFVRRGERGWATSVISYAVIITAMLVAFPAYPELGMTVTIIIAFGDGSATLAGKLMGGKRLPWNRRKSWVGFSAFLLCSAPLATLAFWGEARPGLSLPVALACVVPTVLAAALAESLPTRINDNIRVGVAAGLTISITHAMFVG